MTRNSKSIFIDDDISQLSESRRPGAPGAQPPRTASCSPPGPAPPVLPSLLCSLLPSLLFWGGLHPRGAPPAAPRPQCSAPSKNPLSPRPGSPSPCLPKALCHPPSSLLWPHRLLLFTDGFHTYTDTPPTVKKRGKKTNETSGDCASRVQVACAILLSSIDSKLAFFSYLELSH